MGEAFSMSSKREPRTFIIPVLIDLSKRYVPVSNEPFACWIDGQVIPVTSLVLNMMQSSSVAESWITGFDAIVQTPSSWEVEGEILGIEAACMSLLDTWFHTRKECKVEFVNTNVTRMQRFKSKGILTSLALSSITTDCSFTITGTAELIEIFE